MAPVAPPADQAADLLQKLSLDSQTKTSEIPEVTKKASVDSSNKANGALSDRSATPVLPDPSDPAMFYHPNGYPSTGYYYTGYNTSGNEWEDYTRYVNSEGVEMNPGAYGDNGYYQHAYGYAPYAPYSPATSPVPTMGHDGQLYGAQPYQYPSPYFQSLSPTSAPFPNPAAPAKGEIATSATSDQVPLNSTNTKSNAAAKTGGAKGDNFTHLTKSAYNNSSFNMNGCYGSGAFAGGVPASTYQDPRFGFDGMPSPWLESAYFSDGHPRPLTNSSMTSSIANGNSIPSSKNQNFRPQPMGLHHSRPMSGMNTANGFINRMYPNKFYGQYDRSYRTGLAYGSNGYDTRSNGRGWMAFDSKYKPRGRGNGFYGYGNESIDGLNELNRGPRTKSTKNENGFTPVALVVKGQNIPLAGTAENEKESIPNREQYNQPSFPETYTEAKFFIIKSYSEDDVHKSIKYNVWASTPNGNKKLDAAYLDAQQKTGGCPVFLFFSVNTSGQFVGVAEMVGSVDFNKNVEYWQQDKWVGCFPVKWHIVKDVPNSLLKHITLENNENKPVTNSRDTQEVKLDQGLQVLKIFKEHSSKQCILDDFDFYEDRQKRILEKKAKQQQLQKQAQQIWEGKHTEEKNKDSSSDLKVETLAEVASVLDAETVLAVQVNGESKIIENSLVTGNPAVVQEKAVANGVAIGC